MSIALAPTSNPLTKSRFPRRQSTDSPSRTTGPRTQQIGPPSGTTILATLTTLGSRPSSSTPFSSEIRGLRQSNQQRRLADRPSYWRGFSS
eukprot:3797824-Rhodomonas_salina.1